MFDPSTIPCSNRTSSDSTRTPVDHRKHMKEKIVDELGQQTWRFDAERVAQMLSRKTRKPTVGKWVEGDIDTIQNYDLEINHKEWAPHSYNALREFQATTDRIAWPDRGSSVEDFYVPIVELLNAGLNSWRNATEFNGPRLYSKLQFEVTRGNDHPQSDIIGACSEWPEPAKLAIPVVVMSDFSELMAETGLHAHHLFSTTPFRQFALAIAFDCTSYEFTCLIYHRGGQTRSYPIQINTIAGIQQIHRIFHALMTWRSAEDAGVPLLFDGADIHLPLRRDDDVGSAFRVRETMSSKACIKGRANHVIRVTGERLTAVRQGNRRGRRTPRSAPVLRSKRNDIIVPRRAATVSRTAKRKLDESTFAEEERVRQSTSRKRISRQPPGNGGAEAPGGDGSAREVLTNELRKSGKRGSSNDVHALKCNSARYVKPVTYRGDDKSVLSATEDLVVKFSCNEDKNGSSRCLEADLLESCSGIFGTAKHRVSFPVCTTEGVVMSNHFFVPGPHDTEEDIAQAYAGVDSNAVPQVERRTPWIHVNDYAGHSLIMMDTPKQMFISIYHCLLGWLGMLCRLYLHCDISIGNLVASTTAMKSTPFDLHYEEQDWEAEYERLGFKDEPTLVEIQEQMKKLDQVFMKLGISEECYGSIIDGDMVYDLRTHWDFPQDEQPSGTYEFMSVNVMKAREHPLKGKAYLKTPLDDLFSFYYVCQWAAVFHKVPKRLDYLEWLRKELAGSSSHRGFATYETITSYAVDLEEETYGPFLTKCQPILRDWYNNLLPLNLRWDRLQKAAKKRDLNAQQQKNFYIRNFIAFAREGVAVVGDVLLDHWDELSS